MKYLLSLILIMVLFNQKAISQNYFSFNDAINHDEMGVVKLASMNSPAVEEVQKTLAFTGPFLVNHDFINQQLEIELTNVFDVLDYEIQDMNGFIIKSPGKKEAKKIQVDLDHLPKGLYVLKLRGSEQTFTTKIQHGI